MVAEKIHRTASVGPGVELGQDVVVGPYAVLTGPMTVGDRTWIGAGAALGGPPETKSARMNSAWVGDLDHAGVVVGADVVVRENAVVHQGTWRPTVVGDGVWLMNRSYVAHDVEVGESAVLSAGVSVGGHVTIGARANIGLNASVHQRRVVGPGAMVGMGTALARDVPPFALVYGSPARLEGVNAHLLRLCGYSDEVVDALRRAYEASDDLTAVTVTDELAPVTAELDAWNLLVAPRPVRSGSAAR
ncbi:DapH/DapD/GlmU-related protein [Oerskovia paurometabola]|uniref:DapH/DapD/GlmU-related protein n=1 Tax=Oerskovia paurometabola TaxID=162170 RepID=A0ABW1X6N1_9CELL|nr:DapH/DapD/GlmU-related protein [Oerskovia paurometabola]MBM7496426.1 UDP-N-acetylglucosamine acyltransferase [Oerskovia paurometabola]